MHPYNAEENLLGYCREKGIAVTAYSSLGAGSYIDIGQAEQWESCLEDPVIIKIGKAHNKSPA